MSAKRQVTKDEPQPRQTPQDAPDSRADQAPLLRVIKGDPTPEELAALVAVIAAAAGGAVPARRRPPEWGAHHRKVRVTLPHGPGGWRSSALPR